MVGGRNIPLPSTSSTPKCIYTVGGKKGMEVEVFLTFPFYYIYLVAIYAKTGHLFCENEEKEKEVREQF